MRIAYLEDHLKVTVTDLEEKLEKLTKENAYLEKSLETKKKDNHEMAEKIRDLDA